MKLLTVVALLLIVWWLKHAKRMLPLGDPERFPETGIEDPRLMEFVGLGTVVREGDRLMFPPIGGVVELSFVPVADVHETEHVGKGEWVTGCIRCAKGYARWSLWYAEGRPER